MNSPAFENVHSVISPIDASKLTGRFETTAEVDGKCNTCQVQISCCLTSCDHQADFDASFHLYITGKHVPVLRSIRHASKKKLVLRGSIGTPTKPSAPAVDVNGLCNMFEAKAKVTPMRKKVSGTRSRSRSKSNTRAPSARYAQKEAECVKENLGKTLKSTRFSDDVKKPAASPIRHSIRRSSNRRRTRSMDSTGGILGSI